MKLRIVFAIIISMLLVGLTACGKADNMIIDSTTTTEENMIADDTDSTTTTEDNVITDEVDSTTTNEDNVITNEADSTTITENTEPQINTEFSMSKKNYEGLNYWLYTPSNAKDNMPLIIYLHGGSGKGDDLDLITNVDGFPKYIKEGTLSADAYIVFPQCPSDQNGWNVLSAKIEELINYTCNEFSINTDKISITGHSMGGAGTWTLALSNPNLFYKIAPMSGSVKTNDTNLEKLSAIPVWAFVGGNEKSTTIDSIKAIVESLKNIGADAQITILEGATHFEVPSIAYLDKTLNIIEWLIE